MRPTPAPEVAGNTPWEKLDNAVRKIFTVPKESLLADNVKREKARARKRRKRIKLMDILSVSERSKRMSLIRSKDTKPEIFVRGMVHRMGYRYALQARDLPGHPDMAFRARRKVIFVHGCFWHLHEDCRNNRPPKSRREYWKPKLKRNAERDVEARRKLRKLGWRSLVVWECELAKPAKLSEKLTRFLGPRAS